MAFWTPRRTSWGMGTNGAAAPSLPSVERSFERDHVEQLSAVRIRPPEIDQTVEVKPGEMLHVAAQCLAEGRAQVAEYAASASAAVRETLAEARARRFEAVQQGKARRIMLQSYREALQRQADATRILGPHVRYAGGNSRSLWITLFLIGDTAGMTLALTYGGESPFIAALMAVAIGAAVVVCGKTAEDLRRESLLKNLEHSKDPEAVRFVDAVFGVSDVSRKLNRRVLAWFIAASSLAGLAIAIYRATEESLLVGIAFGLWALLISAGSFAANWVFYDPATTYIALTEDAVAAAEDIWRSTEIDAIEEHNAGIETARHIVAEHRQRAEAAWNMSIANAIAVMANNGDVIGVAHNIDDSMLNRRMPDVLWPDLSTYQEIVDPDDVRDGTPDNLSSVSGTQWTDWPVFSESGTNGTPRPVTKTPVSDS